MHNKTYSQHFEDLNILRLLDPDAERFGVDVGANDGLSWSNSYVFGLNGYNLLLVEPMPEYADRCRELYQWNNRVSVEQVAVSPSEGETTFYVNRNIATDELAMRSSLSRDAVPSDTVEAITVPTAPLHLLLEKHRCPSRYAFLSVDAEGHDLAVLQTAALDRFRPSVICVEEGEQHAEVADYLEGFGYRFEAKLGPNGLYVG